MQYDVVTALDSLANGTLVTGLTPTIEYAKRLSDSTNVSASVGATPAELGNGDYSVSYDETVLPGDAVVVVDFGATFTLLADRYQRVVFRAPIKVPPQAPSANANAAAVWEYLVASADALGVTKMGGWIRTLLINMLNILSTSPIQVRNLIDAGGSMRIVTADDYPAGRAIQFGIPDTFMSLTGSTPKLVISKTRGGIPSRTPTTTFTGTILTGSYTINAVTYTRIIQFTPTALETASLTDWSPNAYLYTVRAVWTSPAQTITLVTPSSCTALW